MVANKQGGYSSAAFADVRSLRMYYPLRHASEGGFRIGDLEIAKEDRTQHILVMGGTGAGKGVTLMIPNLIRDMMAGISTVFCDKKGEMYEFLSRVHTGLKKRKPGYNRLLLAFSPFDPTSTVCWNPIDSVRTVGEARDWAEIILNNSEVEDITGVSGGAAFYRNNERALLQSLILWVNNTEYRKVKRNNFAAIMKLLNLKAAKKAGQTQLRDRLIDKRFLIEVESRGGEARPAWEVIKDDLQDFFELDDKDTIGIIKGLKDRLSVFRDPRVAAATHKSELDLKRLGNEAITLVLNVPSDEGVKSELLAAMFLEGLIKNLRQCAVATPEKKCPVPVSIYADEAGNLGSFPLPDWLTLLRSYSISLIAVFQDLGQIRKKWGLNGADTILTNANVQVVLYNCGVEAAKYYSKKVGDAVTEKEVKGRSVARRGLAGNTVTKSENQKENLYPLMPAHAIDKMEVDGKIGIEYKADFFGRPLVDDKGRHILSRVRALVFTFKCRPTITWLYPFFSDKGKEILALMKEGESMPLRKPEGPLPALDYDEILSWDVSEGISPSGSKAPANMRRLKAPSEEALRGKPPKRNAAGTQAGKGERNKSTPVSAEVAQAAAAVEAALCPYPKTAICPRCGGEEHLLALRVNPIKSAHEYFCKNDGTHIFDAKIIKSLEAASNIG
ncbi:type IV secretory system conjugative DNA transfer family protein [Gloeobacter morelensis]|uniref:type IV secretory system conjugative DNA transfer family protein n=1 Tax=Gloeobacter morelensis TaxID=2907343 RepID=UPI001E356B24|nr:type IV secretory system conjugative DNA transfer family protein [Gloeobacter morelensis]UFP97236.1 type IV secretory system conjugative DNA transfer family protein [Gloeobacter morelensis MG652769]